MPVPRSGGLVSLDPLARLRPHREVQAALPFLARTGSLVDADSPPLPMLAEQIAALMLASAAG